MESNRVHAAIGVGRQDGQDVGPTGISSHYSALFPILSVNDKPVCTYSLADLYTLSISKVESIHVKFSSWQKVEIEVCPTLLPMNMPRQQANFLSECVQQCLLQRKAEINKVANQVNYGFPPVVILGADPESLDNYSIENIQSASCPALDKTPDPEIEIESVISEPEVAPVCSKPEEDIDGVSSVFTPVSQLPPTYQPENLISDPISNSPRLAEEQGDTQYCFTADDYIGVQVYEQVLGLHILHELISSWVDR